MQNTILVLATAAAMLSALPVTRTGDALAGGASTTFATGTNPLAGTDSVTLVPMPGWPKHVGTNPNYKPSGITLADINHDSTLEIIVGSTDNTLNVWDYQGLRINDASILPDSPAHDTVERAGQLRDTIKGLHLSYGGHALGTVTVSMGVAIYPEHGTKGSDLIRATDVALCQAKQDGRDRVVVFDQQRHDPGGRATGANGVAA